MLEYAVIDYDPAIDCDEADWARTRRGWLADLARLRGVGHRWRTESPAVDRATSEADPK